jgi:hypothetical protein
MGYFSNGTEGLMYEEDFCQHCVHYKPDDGCAVWLIHLLYSYEECNNDSNAKRILDILIPPSKDHLSNDQCTMYHATPMAELERQGQERLF